MIGRGVGVELLACKRWLCVVNSKHLEPESAAVMRALFVIVIGSEEVIVMVMVL